MDTIEERADRSGRVVKPPRVVIAGGGVAALEAALALRDLAEDRLEVELVAPGAALLVPAARGRRAVRAGGDARATSSARSRPRPGRRSRSARLDGVDTARRERDTSVGDASRTTSLLVAIGAVPTTAVDGALTFRGPADTDKMREPPRRARRRRGPAGRVRRPGGRGLVAAHLRAGADDGGLPRRAPRSRVSSSSLVTPEDEPLQLFGRPAATPCASLLERARDRAPHGRLPGRGASTASCCSSGGGDRRRSRRRAAEAARPAPRRPPADARRLHPDRRARARRAALDDVYAAGDVTTFPVKQGGIATQIADAAAEAIAAQPASTSGRSRSGRCCAGCS